MYEVGDPDPTPWNCHNGCPESSPDGLFCTWDTQNHDQEQHVAGDIFRRVVAVWPVRTFSNLV